MGGPAPKGRMVIRAACAREDLVTDPAVFRVLAALLLIAFVSHRAYYTRKLAPAERETIDKLQNGPASAVASILIGAALISTLAFVFLPALLAWANSPFPDWLRWLGLAVTLAGFGLLEWAHRALGKNWSDQPRMTESQHMVTSGPYRWIHHPIYTAFLLILGSLLLISANWLVGLAWVISVSVDGAIRIRYEERVMADRFGDRYREYMRRTGRILPRL